MKKIIILGAGIYQVPLIKKAKEMGLYVICISIPGDYPGFEFADKVYYIDTRAYEEVLAVAKKEGIEGIVTTGTDVALKTVGYVNNEMHLAGISYESAALCADKSLMKDAFAKDSVNTAEHKRVYSLEEAAAFMEQLGDSIVIKPVDSSGSRGISIVSKREDLEEAYNKAASISKQEYVIVERFIDGEEIGIDCFIAGGSIKFIAPHGKINYYNGKTNVPVGHYFPLDASEELINNINAEADRVIRALKLDNCAVNMDVIIRDNKPFILEASGRCGATCIPELISMHYGFDYYEEMLKCALGEKVEITLKDKTPCVGKLLYSEKSGTIVSQHTDEFEDVKVNFDYKVGDTIRKFEVGPDRIGQIVAKGSARDCEKRAEIVVD